MSGPLKIIVAGHEPGARPGGSDSMPPEDWRQVVATCRRARPGTVTVWGQRFLAGLLSYRELSPRQREILDGIWRKVAAG
jgi:hypothetical protein